MKLSFQNPIIAGALLAGVSCTSALADEPVSQSVIVAPAPEAVLLDPDSPAASPRGGEMTLQIDTLVEGGAGTIQLGFVAGEIGAVTYNIDPALFPIKILRVQILWVAALPTGEQSLEDSIHFYTGNFNLLASLEGPVMTEGGLNEFDVSALPLVINNPTPLTVGFQFFNNPVNAQSPSLITDNDGCQSGQNWVFVNGTTWLNLCNLGVSGDLVIRTIIDPMGSILPCPGDINDDGVVDTADLGLFLAVFGQMPPSIPEADINGDGVADTADLGLLLGVFGTPCP